MLTLTSHQLDLIGDSRFRRRLVDLLLESVPDSRGVINTPEGLLTLREQCAKARSYGLSAELDVADYVISAWMLGVDFDTRFPAMHEILLSPQLTASEKASLITQVTSVVLSELEKGQG